jgi:hypothetical protein
MEDRSILVAVQLEKAEHCSLCGLSEATWIEDPTAYVAVHKQCPWCAAKDTARSALDTDSKLPGGRVELVPRAVAERMAEQKGVVRPMSPRERAKKDRR